ncbi:retrovirus-related pol polyprotein from transposon TNT 1-94 [Tanacetum coccineum]
MRADSSMHRSDLESEHFEQSQMTFQSRIREISIKKTISDGTVSDILNTGGTEGASSTRSKNDIYSHPITIREPKDIWENVEDDLEGSELTKDDRESQLYDEFEHFHQVKGEGIQGYYVRFVKPKSDPLALVSDALSTACYNWERTKGPLAREFPRPKRLQDSNYFKEQMIPNATQEKGAVLDEETNDLALNVDHIFEADECDAFDSDVDEGPTSQTMFMASLTSEDPIYDEAGPSYDSNNPLEYVEDNEEHVVQCNASSVRNDALMSILDEMHEQGVQNDNNRKKAETLALKPISALTVYPPNTPVKLVPRILPTKSQGLTEGERGFEQTKRCYLTEVIPFFKTLKEHFVGVQTALFKEVKVMEEIFDQMNDEVDQNAVDKQCAEIEKKNLLIENENLIVNCLSTQLLYDMAKSRCLDLEADVSKVHDESKLISKLEREYLNLQLKYQHLQESFENKKSQASQEAPDFRSFFKIKNLEHQIQEKDNVIGHLKDLVTNVNDRSREPYSAVDVTALIEQNNCDRLELGKSLKAQLRVKAPCLTSDKSNQKFLALLARINDSTEASGSKPRSNTKKNRILPAKKENKKEVEVRPRTNKSVWTKVNPVDSNISSKRVVINSNSESVCKTCNKRVNFASHEMCVANIFKSVSATPTVSNSLNKTKQIWKPKEKLSDNSLSKTQRVWKATGKLFADIGYQWRPTGKRFTLGKLDCVSQWRPTGKKFALGEICQLTKLSVKCSTLSANQQVMLWYLDSGCSKHMTGNHSKLMNFVDKFIGSVRFGNDHLGAIMGYGDYVMGESVISRVYYVEGLGHNLFSVGQFYDSELEVAFRKHTCCVRDLNGTDILKGSHGTNLYTISIDEMMKSSPICLLSKASKSKSWLWHRRLNHLNFGSACQHGKSKKFSHRPKSENTNMEVLHTLHMDLCGPMRVQSIKGKKYILVIVDDYSRFTWVKFLRSKNETPEFVTNFLKQIQVGLNKTVKFIRTDNETEFVNQVMSKCYEGVGIFHQKSVLRTPQQNGVVERRNRILVEAASTMLIFSKAPMFLWAAAVATACYTQNRSLKYTRHNKTPYELVHDKKPDLTFLRVFGTLCYPTNDSEDLGKLQAKAEIGIFIGYAPSRKCFRI